MPMVATTGGASDMAAKDLLRGGVRPARKRVRGGGRTRDADLDARRGAAFYHAGPGGPAVRATPRRTPRSARLVARRPHRGRGTGHPEPRPVSCGVLIVLCPRISS